MGSSLRRIGLCRPSEPGLKLKQQVIRDSAVQKGERLFVALLAGAKAVPQASTTVRAARALQVAVGRPGCADQTARETTASAGRAGAAGPHPVELAEPPHR